MKKNSFDIYSYAMESGILNMDDVEEAVNKRRKAEILEKHPYSIWQGKDGRWRTHIADETMDSARKLVVKSTKEALHASIFAYYENQDEARKSASITLKDLYPRWLKYKELHSEASTYITRINSDWKTYYLDKLTLDVWAHSLIKEYNMTKTNYYNVTVILRQALDYAVDLNIVDANAFRLVKVNTKKRRTTSVRLFVMIMKYFLEIISYTCIPSSSIPPEVTVVIFTRNVLIIEQVINVSSKFNRLTICNFKVVRHS